MGSEGMWQDGHPRQNKTRSSRTRPWLWICQAGQRDSWKGGPTEGDPHHRGGASHLSRTASTQEQPRTQVPARGGVALRPAGFSNGVSPRKGLGLWIQPGRIAWGKGIQGDAGGRSNHDPSLGPCRQSQGPGEGPGKGGAQNADFGLPFKILESPGSFDLGDIDLCFGSRPGCHGGWAGGLKLPGTRGPLETP